MELNEQQLAIVNAPADQNMVVIAGAGTGKTRVIVSRIKSLLSVTDVNPNQILAISFSKDTSKELDSRLTQALGSHSKSLQSRTFNSLGWSIINRNKTQAQISSQVKLYQEFDMQTDLQKLFKTQYGVNMLRRNKEDVAHRELAGNACIAHLNCDRRIHNELYQAYLNSGGNITIPFDFVRTLPLTSKSQWAQAWTYLYSQPLKPDLYSQEQFFDLVFANPNMSNHVRTLQNSYVNLLGHVLTTLHSAQTFLPPQALERWKIVLELNHGSLDIAANCLQYIDAWYSNENNGKKEIPDDVYALASDRFNFSIQEALTYVLKRKEEGALPRISLEKYLFYKNNFHEFWNYAFPCDLIRLQKLAPDSAEPFMTCPFNFDHTMSLESCMVKEETRQFQHLSQSVMNNKMHEQNHDANTDNKFQGQDHNLEQYSENANTHNDIGTTQNIANKPNVILHHCDALKRCSFCPFFLDWYEWFFAFYEEWREENNYFDFPEQINRCVRLLNNEPQLRKQTQQKFRFIFVDEFQDTNSMQYSLLCLLKTDVNDKKLMPNYVCVVGDDDQSIYGWRGANFYCLRQILPVLNLNLQDIYRLTINYRSHQNILNLANSLIQHNADRVISKRLVCPDAYIFELQNQGAVVGIDHSSPKVNIVGFDSYRIEGMAVGQAVRFLHDEFGVEYGQIAILFRLNFMSSIAEFALVQQQIPYSIREGAFTKRPAVINAIAALRLALDPEDDDAFIRYCHVFDPRKSTKMLKSLQAKQYEEFHAEDKDVDWSDDDSRAKSTRESGLDSLLSKASKDKNHDLTSSMYSTIEKLCETDNHLSTKELDMVKFFRPLYEKISLLQTWKYKDTFEELVRSILSDSGILSFYNKESDSDDLEQDYMGKEDALAINQLFSIATMYEQEEQSKDSRKCQEILDLELEKMNFTEQEKAELQALVHAEKVSDLSNQTLDNTTKQRLVELSRRVNNKLKEIKLKKIEEDPFFKIDSRIYSNEVVQQRAHLRKLILQLCPQVNAPWKAVLLEKSNTFDDVDIDDSEKVQLLSIHASKGKEFKAVIVLGFEKNILPFIGTEREEEERRLAYVAITRAKRYLFLTFSRNRLTRFNSVVPTGRSPFISEIQMPWVNESKEFQPYKMHLISEKDFYMSSNIWMERIDK